MANVSELERQVLEQALARLVNLPALLRQTVSDHQWAQIPLMVRESNYAASQPANVQLEARRQFDVLELITGIVVTLPSGGTGLLQLGDVTIPVGAGVNNLGPVEILLSPSDIRGVVCNVEGPLSLLLTGRQMPTTGAMSG